MKKKIISLLISISIIAGTVGTGYVSAAEPDDTITIENYGFEEEPESSEEESQEEVFEESSEESTEETSEETSEEQSKEKASSVEDVVTTEGYFEGYEAVTDTEKASTTTMVNEISGAVSYSQEFPDVIVNVDAPAGVFPEGTRISIAKRYVSQKVFEEYKAENTEIKATYSFDIKAYDTEGNEVQPNTDYGTVSVTFSGVNIAENTEVSVYHISDDLKSVDEVISDNQISTDNESGEVVVECEHFSVYTVVFGTWINNQFDGKEILVSLNQKIYVKDILKEKILEKYPTAKYIHQYNTSVSSGSPTKTYTSDGITMLCGTLDESYIQFTKVGVYSLNVYCLDADFGNLTGSLGLTIVFSVQNTSIHDYQIGDNIYGDLDETTGELSITGTGAMWKNTQMQNSHWGTTDWFVPEDKAKIKTIAFSEGITEIYGLNNFPILENIVFPDTLRILGKCFNDCPCLKKCILPEGLEKIIDLGSGINYSSNFYNCGALTEIHLPDSLTSISSGSFNNCDALTEVTIPANVLLGSECFVSCDNLNKIDIYAAKLNYRCFWGCTYDAIVNIYSDTYTVEKSEQFSSGVVINVYSDEIHFATADTREGYYKFNETRVYNEAISTNSLFDTATGEYIENGTVSNSLASFLDVLNNSYIPRKCYGTYSTNDKVYMIHNSGENVGLCSGSFYPGSRFYSLMEKLVIDSGTYTTDSYTGNRLFLQKHINVIELNSASFSNNLNLYGIYKRSDTGNYISEIESGTVYNCTLTKCEPQYIFGSDVYGTYDTATETLYIMGNGGMQNNSSVSYTADTDIKDEVKHIVVYSGVTSFYSGQFFKNHTNLEDVYFDNITMSGTHTSIGVLTTPSGEKITVLTSGVTYNGLYTYEASNYQLGSSVYAKFNISTKTLSIFGSGAMYTASYTNYQSILADIRDEIEHIVIGEGVTSTGGASSSSASYCARSVFANIPNLMDVTYPSTITEIKQGSFYGCSKYTISAVPTGITSIGQYAVYVPYSIVAKDTGGNTLLTVQKKGYYHTNNAAETIDFSSLGLRTVVSMPDMDTDDSIVFVNGNSLRVSGELPAKTYTYVLSDKIKEIPDGYHLVNTYNVGANFADDNPMWGALETIKAYLLSNEAGTDYKLWFIGTGPMCALNMTTGQIPWYSDVQSDIYNQSTDSLSKITEVFYSEGITSLSGGSYTGITTVNIPDSVTAIGQHAFAYASNLEFTSDDIPDSVVSIWESAFRDTKVTLSKLPPSMTSRLGLYSANINYKVVAKDLDGNVLHTQVMSAPSSSLKYTVTVGNTKYTGARVVNPNITDWAEIDDYVKVRTADYSKDVYITNSGELSECVILYVPASEADHTLTFNQYDGTKISDVAYTTGGSITTPKDSLIAPTEGGYTYVFRGWRDQNKRIYGDEELKNTLFRADMTFTAYYTKAEDTDTFIVAFKDNDGTTVQTGEYAYGDTVSLPTMPAFKVKNAQYNEIFDGWDKPVATTVTEDATYTACYHDEVRSYTIEIRNVDGSVYNGASFNKKYGTNMSEIFYFSESGDLNQDIMLSSDQVIGSPYSRWQSALTSMFKTVVKSGSLAGYDPTKQYECTGFADVLDSDRVYKLNEIATLTVTKNMAFKPVFEVKDTSSGTYSVKVYNEVYAPNPAAAINYGQSTVGIDTLVNESNLIAEWHINSGDYIMFSESLFNSVPATLQGDSGTYYLWKQRLNIYNSPYKNKTFGTMTDGMYTANVNGDMIITPYYNTSEYTETGSTWVYIGSYTTPQSPSEMYHNTEVYNSLMTVGLTFRISDYLTAGTEPLQTYTSMDGGKVYTFTNKWRVNDGFSTQYVTADDTITVGNTGNLNIYPAYDMTQKYFDFYMLDWDGSIILKKNLPLGTDIRSYLTTTPTREDDYYTSYLFDAWICTDLPGGIIPTSWNSENDCIIQATYTSNYIASSYKVALPAAIDLDYDNTEDKFMGEVSVGVTILKNANDSHPSEYYVSVKPADTLTLTDGDTSETLDVDIDKTGYSSIWHMADLTENGSTYTGEDSINLAADAKSGIYTGNLIFTIKSGYDGE